ALQRTDAAAAGLDPAALDALRRRASVTHSDALVVMRDGKVVVDERFGHPDGRIETMSVTKTIVALVVGRLVADGRIASIDEPIATFFPEWRQGQKRRITIRHLLEMTSGLQAQRTTEEIYASPDFVQLALAAELTSEPGAKFFYNNKAANLLAGVVRVAAGKRLDLVAREELFAPLGIDDVGWTLDRAGNPHAMSGLELRPLDLARVGQLMLDGGRAGDRQVLPASWIAAMTSPSSRNPDYGLLTWLDADRSLTIDAEVVGAWRAAKLEPAFVSRLLPLEGRVFDDKKSFFAAVAAAVGGPAPLATWAAHTYERGLPDGKVVARRYTGFRMNGYLGQHVVVVPSARLVAVRMRRFDEADGDDPRYGFADFPERVHALAASAR
ncbi:MAG TPA: serine hydrolase domain-containing protein, partial [Minicystis sp.]|nr:serine hydrolase domain-containing protein [Minicystis sp.]